MAVPDARLPHLNPPATHGYYRRAPYFSPAQRAAILRVADHIFQGTGAVARLLQAQEARATIRWGPYSTGGTGKMRQLMRRQEQAG